MARWRARSALSAQGIQAGCRQIHFRSLASGACRTSAILRQPPASPDRASFGRVVLVAYTVQSAHRSAGSAEQLLSLGFRIPEGKAPDVSIPTILQSTGELKVPLTFEVCRLCRALSCFQKGRLQSSSRRLEHTPKASSISLDLTSSAGEAHFFAMHEDQQPDYVHAPPPCGTASLARERPLPAHLVRQGLSSPPPVRSPEHIWGIPHVTGTNKAKLESANALYKFTARLLVWCVEPSCMLSIQNSLNSYYWACLVDELRNMGASACSMYNQLAHVVFSNCIHGSPSQGHQVAF